MKKKVLFVASMFLATAMIAQDGLTSKKGEAYLPEAGDWALGFDGTPFLDYAGNMFNGNTGNSVNATWVGNQPAMTVYGKMFKDETTAYRAKVRIGFGSTSAETIGFYDADADPTTNQVEYTNTAKTSNMMITLGGGIEKRRGNTRIQGFYGGEALISFGSSSQSWDYGRAYTDDWNADEELPVNGSVLGAPTSQRVTERKNGSTFQLGLRGFVGVEWFLAPKVSVAAEYGWGLAMSSTGGGEETVEYFGFAENSSATNPSVQSETISTGGSSAFGIDTDNNGGVISIFFHF
jgi:hypothetical protein